MDNLLFQLTIEQIKFSDGEVINTKYVTIDEFNEIVKNGEAGIIDEYCDFIYLLENSEEEIGVSFGEDILKLYGNIDIEKAKEYQKIVDQYYPIETLVYGMKNHRKDFIEKGKNLIIEKINK